MNEPIKFSDLDQMFNESFDRIGRGDPVSPTPYKEGPLASDHFVLKKSWTYFQDRIKTIDEHYRAIIEAKDQQLHAADTELKKIKEEMAELEKKNQYLEAFESMVAETRINDFEKLDSIQKKLKDAFENERIRLHEKQETLEADLEAEREEKERIQKLYAQRQTEFYRALDELKQAQLESEENHIQNIQQARSELTDKDQDIAQRDRKIDLLMNEADRRQDLVHEYKKEIHSCDQKMELLLHRIEEMEKTNHSLVEQVKISQTHIDMLKRERATLTANWKKEQATWRELWDRARENWRQSRG